MQSTDQVFLETLNAEISRKSMEKARADIGALSAAIKPGIAALGCDGVNFCLLTFVRDAENALARWYAESAASDAARSLLNPPAVNIDSIQTLSLKPDDILVVSLTSRPNNKQVEHMESYCKVPGHRVIVKGPECELSVLSPTEQGERIIPAADNACRMNSQTPPFRPPPEKP